VEPPVFGDWVWPVAGLDPVPRKSHAADFTSLSPEWGLTAKEVTYWRYRGRDELRERFASRRRRKHDGVLRAGTVVGLVAAFMRLERAANELGLGLPSTWTLNDTDLLSQWSKENGVDHGVGGIVRDLYEFRDILTFGGLDFDPLRGRDLNEWVGRTADRFRLKGMAVSPQTFAALMRAALAYVDDYSGDILSAHLYRAERLNFWGSSPEGLPSATPEDSAARDDGFLSEVKWRINGFIETHGALPGNLVPRGKAKRGEVSYITLAALLDLSRPATVQNSRVGRKYLREALKAGTPVRYDLMPIPVSEFALPDGTTGPWREGWCWLSIAEEVQTLRYACMIVILALTGMRTSELELLPRNGWRTVWHGHEAITSSLVKTANGDDAKWWATEPVIRACEILETTCPGDAEYLCSALMESKADLDEVGGVTRAESALNAFVEHINTSMTLRGQRDIPAQWRVANRRSTKGERISPHMLRFTLAAIGSTAALGDVALKSQFQHATHAMTWGYMNNGGADDWKNVLVESHAAYGQESVTDMVAAIWADEDAPAGPGGRKVERMARALMDERGVAPFDPTSDLSAEAQFRAIVADEPTLLAFIQSVNRDLHMGGLVHCYDDPAKRQCASIDAEGPVMSMCWPEQCGNALITPQQRPVFIGLIEDIDKALSAKRVPPQQRSLLERRKNQITNHLKTLDDMTGNEG
jgi:hypothetical protein